MNNVSNFEDGFLHITIKELFYVAVMLHIKHLVNIVYNFPADEIKFEQELNEARSTLRKKKLLTESARGGIGLNFALIVCAAFCANPESCEVINTDQYSATIYKIALAYMLMEKRSEHDLAIVWFTERKILDKYIAEKTIQATEKGGKA